MKKHVVRYYLTFSAMLLLFYIALGSCFVLFQSFLSDELHLTAPQIGTVYTFIAFVALFCAPLFGAWQDMLGNSKKLLGIIGIGLVLCFPILGMLMVYVYHHVAFLPAAIIAGLYFGTMIQSGVGTVESYCEQATRHLGAFEYGRARFWAPIGCASATALSGYLLKINPYFCFWVSSISGVLFLLVLFSFSAKDLEPERKETIAEVEAQAAGSFKDTFMLLRSTTFWALISFLFIATGGFMLFDQQFPLFYASLFPADMANEGAQRASMILSVQMIGEAIMTLLLPSLVNKIGARNGLLLGGLVMALRIFLISMTLHLPREIQPYWAGALKLLQAVEVPILIISTFKYISRHFAERFTATIYLLSFQCSQQVSTIFLSSLLGLSYKSSLGYTGTYTLMAIVILAFTILATFTLPRRGQSSIAGDATTTAATSQA
ncbi:MULTISPECIES: oligosaccharide MFS transporter [unclassified Zymobacter]|uniref:oligosaccharide MFS transporter n=1 Tax=unclassified Zymobacter TaxID=3048685 RepID=UPI0039C2B7CC